MYKLLEHIIHEQQLEEFNAKQLAGSLALAGTLALAQPNVAGAHHKTHQSSHSQHNHNHTTHKNLSSESPAQRTASEEGFRSKVYVDTKGHKTVGTGFNLDSPDMKRLVPIDVQNGERELTQQENDEIFKVAYQDAQNHAISFVGQNTWGTLSDNQKGVLTDMSYNIGKAGLNKFHHLRLALQKHDLNGASNAILKSGYASQVPNRAKRNSELILS